MMRYLTFIFALTGLIAHPIASANDLQTQVDQAVQAYQTALDDVDRSRRVQSFGRAESLFAQVIEKQIAASPSGPASGLVSAELYLNLGNAALGAEHLGQAVLAYRRALTVDLNHRQANENLEYARTLLPDWVPTPEQEVVSFGSFFDWTKGLQKGDWFGLAAIVFFILMAAIALFLRTGLASMRYLAILCGIIWIVALAMPWVGVDRRSLSAAVVIVPEVVARSADSIHSPTRFRDPLPSGVELSVIDDRDDWVQVQLSDSRQAWLPASAIESVGQALRQH